MLRTLLLDFSENTSFLLLDIINEYVSSLNVIGIATTFDEAQSFLSEDHLDLVYYDIESCGIHDLTLLNQLKQHHTKIVFIAPNDTYALMAFKYGAIDYLVKPITPSAILNSIERVKKAQFDHAIYNRLDYLIKQNHLGQNYKITIPTSEGINVLSINDIIRVEADRSYSYIYLSDGDRLLVSKPLKEIESMVPDTLFFRVHSAHLINLDFVKQYIKEDGGHILLNNGSHVPIARRRKKEFLERLLSDS